MISFQEQLQKDLNNVFFNAQAKEFVTSHCISGVKGNNSIVFDCNVVVDHDLYKERVSKIINAVENVSIDGLVFFIKKDDWESKFNKIPKVGGELMFDEKRYYVEAANDNMGILEITLNGNRG